MRQERAILIFFEDQQKLNLFRDLSQMITVKDYKLNIID
jgi:hypothetical protein